MTSAAESEAFRAKVQKGIDTDFERLQAEVLKRRAEEAASEAAFRRRSMFTVSFRHESGEIRFRAYWPAPVGGSESCVDRVATEADIASYPAEYAAFKANR